MQSACWRCCIFPLSIRCPHSLPLFEFLQFVSPEIKLTFTSCWGFLLSLVPFWAFKWMHTWSFVIRLSITTYTVSCISPSSYWVDNNLLRRHWLIAPLSEAALALDSWPIASHCGLKVHSMLKSSSQTLSLPAHNLWSIEVSWQQLDVCDICLFHCRFLSTTNMMVVTVTVRDRQKCIYIYTPSSSLLVSDSDDAGRKSCFLVFLSVEKRHTFLSTWSQNLKMLTRWVDLTTLGHYLFKVHKFCSANLFAKRF